MFQLKQIQGNWPIVMVRTTSPYESNEVDMEHTVLVGYFSYINGVVQALDDNVYSIEDEYCAGAVINDEDGCEILVLTRRGNWNN